MEGLIVVLIFIVVVVINNIRTSQKKEVNNSDGIYNTVNTSIVKSNNNNNTNVRANTSELVVELFKAIKLCDHDLYIKYTSNLDTKIDENLKDMMVSDCKNMYSLLKTEEKENLYTFMAIGKKYGPDAIVEYNDQIAKVTKLKEYFDIQDKYNIKNEIRYYENLFKGIMPSPFLNDEEEVEYKKTLSNISENLKELENITHLTEELSQDNQSDKDFYRITEILDIDIHAPSNPVDNITITTILNSIGSSTDSRTDYLYTSPLIICETIIFNFAITKLFLLSTFGMTTNYIHAYSKLENLLTKFVDAFYNGSVGEIRLMFKNRVEKYFELHGIVPDDQLIAKYKETFAMFLLFDKSQTRYIPINNLSELRLDKVKLSKPFDEINDYMMFWFPMMEIDIRKLIEFIKENG